VPTKVSHCCSHRVGTRGHRPHYQVAIRYDAAHRFVTLDDDHITNVDVTHDPGCLLDWSIFLDSPRI
jgi:hypothetical protein